MEDNYQDKIDMFLSGRMPLVDRFNFETELEHNPELKEQFQFTLSLQAELQDREAKKELIKSWEDESNLNGMDVDSTDGPDFVSIASRKKVWYRRMGWAAAAVIVILFVVSLPDAEGDRHGNKQGIAQAQADKYATRSSQFSTNQSIEVASLNLSSASEMLSIEQQEQYWQRAQYYRAQGLREECIQCLRVLLQQEGVYHQKADSLLHIVYQSQQ